VDWTNTSSSIWAVNFSCIEEGDAFFTFREILFKPTQFEPLNSKSSSRSAIDWFAAPGN